jgi:hypothetical protein
MPTDHVLLDIYTQKFAQLVKSEIDSLRCFNNPPYTREEKVSALEEIQDLIQDEIHRYHSLMKKKSDSNAN